MTPEFSAVLMPRLMVAMESTCVAFLLVVLSAYVLLPRSKRLRKDWFFYSLILTVLGQVSDLISWICELSPSPEFLQYSSNFLALIMTSFIVSAFGYYVIDLINEKKKVSVNYAHAITAANFIAVIITVIGAILDMLFDVKALNETVSSTDPLFSHVTPGTLIYNGDGFFYNISMVVSALSLAFLFVLMLINNKGLDKRKIAVFSVYFLLPLFASALELIVPELLFSYIAISISICIIYVLLQGNHMNELRVREKLLNEVSYVDQLTGLLNRRACDRDVALVKQDDRVSIVFCDLNGLKQINDEKGHKAGDQFLTNFASIITKHFPHDSVYRISGDEFVVVARNMSGNEFEQNIARLRQEIDENAGIAALGTISGTGDTIPELVKQAEMSMYADKKNFYRHNPGYRYGKSTYTENAQ